MPKMAKRTSSEPKPLDLDPTSEWRACHALQIWFTVRLNHQLRRRWLLEHKCMQDHPFSQRFRPVVFLEPTPPLPKPRIPSPTNTIKATDKNNPDNIAALSALKTKVHLLRARVEKGKELAAEIERRMLDPKVTFPTHFCHTCVMGGDQVEVLLTRCGHRVCQTCLEFGADGEGGYECSICFVPTSFVHRSPLGPQRSCSQHVSSVSKKMVSKEKRAVKGLSYPLVASTSS